MRKIRKRWWIVLAVVTAIAVAAVVLLPILLDVERHRHRIESALADATGWEVEVGELDFSVARGMVLTASPVTLAAPEEGGSRVVVETLAVKASLMPLLHGILDVERVVLQGPSLSLVRLDEAAGWLLPLPPEEDTEAPGVEGSEPRVELRALEIRDGSLSLHDAGGELPRELSLERIRLVADLDSGLVRGQGSVAEGGSIEWEGNLAEGLTLQLDALSADAFLPWLGEGLIAPGARVSGEARLLLPLEVEADLEISGLTLLGGERPFEAAALALRVVDDEGALRLQRLRFEGGGAVVQGEGVLTPSVALELHMAATPLEVALAASRSILPLPLDVEPPGELAIDIRIDGGESGAPMTVEADGSLSAATFNLGDDLPPARSVRAGFRLDRGGALRIEIVDGNVGGGPLRGAATMASLDPPAPLIFEGGIQEAALGSLVASWLAAGEGRLSGPTGVDANLAVDLTQGEIGPRSLRGRLDLRSRDVQLPGWDLENALRRSVEDKLGASGLGELARRELAGKLDGGKAAEQAGEVVEQLFDSFQASIDFDRWPWGLEQVALKAGGLEAGGEGSFDPESGSIRLALTTRLDETETRALVDDHRELKGLVAGDGRLTLPLEVSGSLVAPSLSVDLGDLLQRRLGEGDTKDAVKGLLRGFLDREQKRSKKEEDKP